MWKLESAVSEGRRTGGVGARWVSARQVEFERRVGMFGTREVILRHPGGLFSLRGKMRGSDNSLMGARANAQTLSRAGKVRRGTGQGRALLNQHACGNPPRLLYHVLHARAAAPEGARGPASFETSGALPTTR